MHKVDRMDKDFWIKVFLFLHVMGAIAALGPTLTYGLWVSLAERSDASTRAFTLRSISWIDGHLPTPAYMAQAVTGVFLIGLEGWAFWQTGWLVVGVSIYAALVVVAVRLYAPAFRRQRTLAEAIAADPSDATFATAYASAARTSTIEGAIVTVLTILVVFLMVWKPDLW
jgi:uncharacterized membrane protein